MKKMNTDNSKRIQFLGSGIIRDFYLYLCSSVCICGNIFLLLLICGCASQAPVAATQPVSSGPVVTAPPEAFFLRYSPADRAAARKFYTKYVNLAGLSIAASGEVSDEALLRDYDIITRLLAGRPDIIAAMAKHGTHLIIMGKDQLYSDMPEYRNIDNAAFMNERVRGTGGFDVTSFGEENLLNLAGDRYDDESIAVHEFSHTIDSTLRHIDPDFGRKLNHNFSTAVGKGLWNKTYAGTNPAEYWAETVTMYFDCERPNNWNHGPINTREELKMYDPEEYDLIRTTFNLTPENDWKLTPMRVQPSVIAPPAKMKVDPYYTKFTYAREFPVLGSSKVSDAAMLKANDTIRKMFAYRHDILKAMIEDGARLVVLGKDEKLTDLPEFRDGTRVAGFDIARFVDYSAGRKLMVVSEENVLGLPSDTFAGECMTVSVMAKGFYQITGLRAVDPNFDRRRDKQQYELHVQRLDARFDQALGKDYDGAMTKSLWKGTTAAHDKGEYWAAGVCAYFDASGDGQPAVGADRPITTRELLKTYDPDLYALVDQTMAYTQHVDWRFKPYSRQAGD
jgi:hypothetical protein